jgi:serine/threonine-protein kinase
LHGYEILEEIGRGGMGEVFLARDPDLNRSLAVKVLQERHRGRPELARRFLKEAQVTGQLQHPGIPPVHEAGTLADGRPFIAMKLIQGRTLAELLAARPSPAHNLPHFLHAFEQVCQAVAYAHSRGVIHRDLKPNNVMVGEFGEVQVMDWGLAKVLKPGPREGREPAAAEGATGSGVLPTVRTRSPGLSSQAGAVLGTFAYMPPEQARGEVALLDERADVFGLGAVLCEVLTGQPPYVAAASWEVAPLAAGGELAGAFARLDGSGADAELVQLAKACLSPEPGARPRDAGEVARALAHYQEGVRERLRQAELERAAARAHALASRRARPRARLAAALLLLGVGGGLSLWLAVRERHDAHAGRVAAARGAARRGDWSTALPLYQRAIEDRASDRPRLEEERLPGFLAVNQVGELADALDRLGGDSAPVLLLRGELALGDPGRREEGQALIRRTLVPPGQLSEADAAYAAALFAANPNEQLPRLEAALRHDPFHHRAHRAWLLLRVARGEYAVARRRAGLLRSLFPDDPLPDLAEALAARLQGDGPALRANLERFRGRVAEEEGARAEPLLDQLNALLEGFGKPELGGTLRYPSSREVEACRDRTGPLLRALGVGAPSLGYLFDALDAVARSGRALSGSKPEALQTALSELARARRAYPEGLLPALEAWLRWNRAVALREREELTEFRRECAAVVELAREATSAPTLVPRSPLLYQARVLGVAADLSLLKGSGEPAEGQLDRLRENLDRLVREGRPWPEVRRRELSLTCATLRAKPTGRMLAEWQLGSPSNAERFEARKRLFRALWRRLLDDWLLDAPKDAGPVLWLAEFELDGGNYEAALNAARRAATLSPRDKEVVRRAGELEARALEALPGPLREPE